jgi:hypothetical protein
MANGHWPIKAKTHTTYRDANLESSQTCIHPHDQLPLRKEKKKHFSVCCIRHCHPIPIENITPHVKNDLKFATHFTQKVILVTPHK